MRELALLEHIYRGNMSLSDRVGIPPGDDMGLVYVGNSQILIATDQLADTVHFDLESTSVEKIGRKAMTRNLSDVAAMAAKPVGVVVAVCLPRGFGADRANQLYDAIRATAEKYLCPLMGGDISIWDGRLVLTVTVLAEPAGVEPVTRSGARPGDVVCVTGQLGGNVETVDGYTHHLDFEPQLIVARHLAGDPNVRPNCMIDLSDGLAPDLRRICEAGGVSAEIWCDRLPIRAAAHQAAEHDQKSAWEHAIGDGEDYELCFTLDEQRAKALPDRIEGVTITQIGVIMPAGDVNQVMIRLPDGTVQAASGLGWEHRS